MSAKLKVEGHEHLVRDREQQGDQIRKAVKEINTLKSELREIKGLIKELVKN